MIRRIICCCTILGMVFSQGAFAEDYEDDDEEFFTRGTIVGEEPDDFRRAEKRARMRNWGLAIGATAVGITTLFLVAKNH